MDIDDDDCPKRYNRNVSELYASSQSLLRQQQPPGGGGTTDAAVLGAKAQELLGPSYYYNYQQPLEQRVSDATSPELEEEIRQDRYEEDIVADLMERTAAHTRNHINEKVEAQIQRVWERDRDLWLQELVGTGTRTLGGATTTGGGYGYQATNNPKNRLLTTDRWDSSALSSATPSGGISRMAPSPRPRPLLADPLHSPTTTTRLDVATVRNHASIVRDKLTTPSAPPPKAAAIQAFLDLTPVSSTTSSSSLDAGYRTAWKLLLHLSDTIVTTTSSTSSPCCDQARTSLACWTLQFRDHVLDRVRRQAIMQQQQQQAQATSPTRTYQSAMANACFQYVTLTLGRTTSDSDVWPVVYYCLRCGDAGAAREVLLAYADTTTTTDSTTAVEACVMRLLDAYAKAQGDATSVWTSDAASPRLNPNDLLAVRELIQVVLSEDLFKSGCYALLACSPLPSNDSTVGFCNIEDYLTSRLWQAVLSINASSPESELIQLGRSIREEFGASYFGTTSNGDNAWAFSLPLLATQQYAEALEHLVRVGGQVGLLQATHLALGLNFIGISVFNLDEETISTTTTTTQDATSLESSLLVTYADAILPLVGAAAALEYVVRIPSNKDRNREIARLIAKTGALDELVGVLNEHGLRTGGAQCLTTFGVEMPLVLAHAADLLLNDPAATRDSKTKAVMCYMLAGRYADVLNLLSYHISPPETADSDRDYWLGATQSFHQNYLAKRTHVVHVLEDTSPNAIMTSRTLLGLNRFFSLVNGGRTGEAWDMLGPLKLLPRSRKDLSAKEAAYRAHDPLVRNSIPALMTCVVQSLFQEHQILLQQRQHTAGDVARSRLQEIKEQTKLYVEFAGMIGLVSDQMQLLSRWEALMS